MSNIVRIKESDRAKALAALYNAARPLGLGFIKADVNHTMTEEEAAEHLRHFRGDIDYLHGRPIKVYFRDEEVHLYLFDRDNGGWGAGRRALMKLGAMD